MAQNATMDYRPVLEQLLQGRLLKDELKKLYLSPTRECVPWYLFPLWARPNELVEGGHEGGRI